MLLVGPLANPDMAPGAARWGDRHAFVLPARSQHAPRRAPRPAAAGAPPAAAGIPDWSQATSSAWPRYQGNFSISLLSPQIGPLADANKGLFMGNVVHHLLLHCIFYARIPQSIFTDKCHCLPLQMAPRGKHGKLSGSTKVAQKARAEVGTELRAPCSQARHRSLPGLAGNKSASVSALPTLQQRATRSLCYSKFRTGTSS